MDTSNYPPGVTGNEPQIAGTTPEWEALHTRVFDALTDLMPQFNAPRPDIDVGKYTGEKYDDELADLADVVIEFIIGWEYDGT